MPDLSNQLRKLYASLATVKGRKENHMFIAQGTKCVTDTIDYFQLETLIALPQWIQAHRDICTLHNVTPAKASDLQKITTLSTPPEVIAVYHIPDGNKPELADKLTLALDCVQDPGNLGTIIRIADWMGIDTILASHDTVDVWSPKVIQATMGAVSRVQVYYCDLAQVLERKHGLQVFGTFLGGENIFTADLPAAGIVVMGNEGKGISKEISRCVDRRLTIPSYPVGAPTSESLNVAVATAITLSEFRRRCF